MRTSFVLLILSSLLVGTACTVNTTETAPRNLTFGTLQVDWSIGGVLDPNLCYQSGAATMAIEVYDARDELVASVTPRCEAMVASFDLYPGSYYANATLLDAVGRERTTSVSTSSIFIYEAERTSVPIDFPSRSFY